MTSCRNGTTFALTTGELIVRDGIQAGFFRHYEDLQGADVRWHMATAYSPKALILCVDDYQPILDGWRTLLTSAGYQVLVAADWKSGLRLFYSHPADVVVLDYEIPGMTCAVMAGAMKCLRPEVPILVVADEGEGSASRMDTPFADACVLKSDSISVLLSSITTLLLNRHQASAGTFEAAVRTELGGDERARCNRRPQHALAA
jgi:DNA-binding response OmpR family regulator